MGGCSDSEGVAEELLHLRDALLDLLVGRPGQVGLLSGRHSPRADLDARGAFNTIDEGSGHRLREPGAANEDGGLCGATPQDHGGAGDHHRADSPKIERAAAPRDTPGGYSNYDHAYAHTA